jgi:hypothetical protein
LSWSQSVAVVVRASDHWRAQPSEIVSPAALVSRPSASVWPPRSPNVGESWFVAVPELVNA